jgi:hypothetical protein
MVGNRPALALVIVGIALAIIELSLPRVATALYTRSTPSPGALGRPSTAPDVPVIWRDFRPGERQTGPGTTVRVCAAAVERGAGRSVLIVRFCDALPLTAQRRFAFGFEDLVIRADLPGGITLAYDLLDYDARDGGGSGFREGPLQENTAPIDDVDVDDATDVVFVLSRELPLGMPSIEVTGRYAGSDVRDAVAFTSLGADLERTEAARVASAPEWTRSRY